jgi:hypothetical protein
VSVEAEGTKPVSLAIDLDIVLSPTLKDLDVKRLVDEALNAAFAAAEKYLRALKS